ncbi:hypothetical protein Droror1_Dr00007385 [Drosera rotundifolia]
METEQDCFYKSLQELRELRSQIHHAADHCKTSFLDAQDKKAVMDNTKEYICRAVVTIVDHLGSVSCILDRPIKESNNVSGIELRVTILEQKLRSHEHYNQNLALSKACWSVNVPRCYPLYISRSEKPVQELWEYMPLKPEGGIDKQGLESDDMLNSIQRSACKLSIPKSPSPLYFRVVPAASGFGVSSQAGSPIFHFQASKGDHQKKHKRRPSSWKSMYDKDILSRILWRKDASKL